MSTEIKIELINPKCEPLSPEKLRELSGLNLSDEQAEEVIWSLTRFARFIYDLTAQQEQSANTKENQTLREVETSQL
jgi:hypothetical protein